MFKENLLLIGVLIIIIISLNLTGCSSSSQDRRYGREKEEMEESDQNVVRFTSDDDEDKHKGTLEINKDAVPASDDSEFDSTPPEENPVERSEFIRKYKKFGALSSTLTQREKVLFEIIDFLETPYLYGGETSNGIDCSAFTRQVYQNSMNISLPRTAREQFQIGEKIKDVNELKFGDLVYFNTSKKSYPGHVGIYLGEMMFAHASLSLGVTISSLQNSYYAARFISGTRIENFE